MTTRRVAALLATIAALGAPAVPAQPADAALGITTRIVGSGTDSAATARYVRQFCQDGPIGGTCGPWEPIERYDSTLTVDADLHCFVLCAGKLEVHVDGATFGMRMIPVFVGIAAPAPPTKPYER